jgi:YidC/Oxa1 family membrane protein insertase
VHEGLIGAFGDNGLQEETYSDIEKKKAVSFSATNVWLGITDRYWAATLIPDPKTQVSANFSTGTIGNIKTYQTDYVGPAQTIAPGGAAAVDGRLFAGAKEVSVVDNYDKALHLNRFELLIDWGCGMPHSSAGLTTFRRQTQPTSSICSD